MENGQCAWTFFVFLIAQQKALRDILFGGRRDRRASSRNVARLGILFASALGFPHPLGGGPAGRICGRQSRSVRSERCFSRRTRPRLSGPDILSQRIFENPPAIQL